MKEATEVQVIQLEKGNPAVIVSNGETAFVQLSKYRISPIMKSVEEAKKWVVKTNLKICIDISSILLDGYINSLKNNKDE